MENTAIEWTDNSLNPIIGCTKIAPGCDNCYAAKSYPVKMMGIKWGPGEERRETKSWEANALRWNRKAAKSGVQAKVFCASLSDICDKEWPDGVRDRLWDLIRLTPHLTWQLLTKRSTLINKYIPEDIRTLRNVWLGVSVEDRMHGVRRIHDLLDTECNLRWLSVEPLLEDLDLWPHELEGIGWVVIGGESGPGARKLDGVWVERIINSCREAKVPVFFKQWGVGAGHHGGCDLNGIEIKEFPCTP